MTSRGEDTALWFDFEDEDDEDKMIRLPFVPCGFVRELFSLLPTAAKRNGHDKTQKQPKNRGSHPLPVHNTTQTNILVGNNYYESYILI